MFKRSFFLILSVLTVLFMSTVRYDGNHTINQQLSEAGVITVPAFLLPTSESDSKLISSFLKPNVSPAEVLKTMKVPALRGQMDDALTQELKRKLNANPIWRKLLANKRLSVGIVDMSNEGNVKFAALNGRHMMYAASLPKIAVLAAAHDAIERGELKETAEIKRDMLLMIAKSNNAATTRMIDRLGFAHIERTMTDPNLKLYDPAFGGGLWVGKRYAGGGKRSPDPMKGISHAATTEQICRYFYLLANDELVSEESSEKMRSYLVDPQLHHKFVNTLDRIAPDAKVYRKSGSWSSFHADVAMVQGPGRNYIMTALVDDPAGERICRELAAVLDGILKE
jgi:beta-lactamase class A